MLSSIVASSIQGCCGAGSFDDGLGQVRRWRIIHLFMKGFEQFLQGYYTSHGRIPKQRINRLVSHMYVKDHSSMYIMDHVYKTDQSRVCNGPICTKQTSPMYETDQSRVRNGPRLRNGPVPCTIRTSPTPALIHQIQIMTYLLGGRSCTTGTSCTPRQDIH